MPALTSIDTKYACDAHIYMHADKTLIHMKRKIFSKGKVQSIMGRIWAYE